MKNGTKEEKTEFYREDRRPQFHFSARDSWINDPNGLVYFCGEYHLCYQTNPHSAECDGNYHWGHATSPDLIHWKEHEPVLFPDAVGKIWSGTSAVDSGGLSGFFDGGAGVVAAYSTNTQNIGIAYSRDGYKFTKVSESAPVVACPEGVSDFRDPHIFYYPEDKKWKLAVAGGLLRIYESGDLCHFSPCGPAQNEYKTECPNLIRMTVDGENEEKWVLSLGGRDYVVGSFDGKRFVGETDKIIMNDGADTYAGITFSDVPDGRVIMISWLNRWWYAKTSPDGRWNGCFTLPVEMRLTRTKDSYRLIQNPVKEVEKLRCGLLFSAKSKEYSSGENPLEGVFADTYEMLFTVDTEKSSAFEIGLRKGDGDCTRIRFSPIDMKMTFDRSESAEGSPELVEKFNPREFTVSDEAVQNGKLSFRIFVDRTSVELFVGGGFHYFVQRIQPRSDSKGMSISADAAVAMEEIRIYALDTIWK